MHFYIPPGPFKEGGGRHGLIETEASKVNIFKKTKGPLLLAIKYKGHRRNYPKNERLTKG